MNTVLLVDDEPKMLELLTLYLSPHGYRCIKSSSATEALDSLERTNIDVILLDVMMPETDGWETCKKIREISNVPIIMLTARSDKNEIVKGLKLGADDYVAKPFDEEELLARMEAVLRRTAGDNEEPLLFKELALNEDAFEVFCGSQRIPMTKKEFSLLSLFLNYQNKVFSRDHLLSAIWGLSSETEDRTVDSHIRNIREKLRQAEFPIDQHLKTVWGVGYKWSTKKE
ncbi:response regulator transcription factor [Actinomycetes bacterium NPDC127524]